MDRFKRNIDIILILAIGFLLRFTVSITHSYSNDELSAVSRLRYTNFSDLIEFGVQKDDMHPAGVQVFMKAWSMGFGKSEWAMRFPFVLFGTAAIFVLFLIGKQWFNRKVGLIAAGMLAVLYFPIMNSEFARPYSPGLLISLLVGYYFYKVLFEENKQLKNAIVLGVLFALGMYTHYFAFLFVAFIGGTGLLFLNKTNWKYYLLSGGLGIVLFLPHIGVTSYHLSVGGLQWLGPPDIDWLPQFLFYAFNSSWTVVAVTLFMLVLSLRKGMKREEDELNRNAWLPVIWFFGIYILGHILSLISTPVLKFPVMLFAFPYFLLILAIFISRIPSYKGILSGLLLVILVSTVTERDLFGNRHYALFKEVGIKIADWNKTYGSDNIYTIYNLNNPDYMNFYVDEWGGDSIHFDWWELEFDSDYQLYKDLSTRTEEYCVVGYSSRVTLVQVFEAALAFYPEVVDYENYNNGAVFLLKKADWESIDREEMVLARFDAFTDFGEWSYDSTRAVTQNKLGATYYLDKENPYGPEFRFQPLELPAWEDAYIKVEVEAAIEEGDQLTVAMTGERDGAFIQHRGENMWIGRDLEGMLLTSEQDLGFFAFEIPPYILKDDKLKISLWNRGETPITIESFTVSYVENIWNR